MKTENKQNDLQLQAAIQQGWVPPLCEMAGALVWALMMRSEDPCAGCHNERTRCKGRPRQAVRALDPGETP